MIDQRRYCSPDWPRAIRWPVPAGSLKITWLTPSALTTDDDGDEGNLEPISSENIISGGRRTRGKNIDFQEAAEKLKNDEMDDSDDDEDFAPNDDNDDDDQMRQ